MSDRRVVITGMGAVSPLGNDLGTTWESAVDGCSGIGRISLFDATKHSSQVAGEVKEFDYEDHIAKKDVRRYDRFSIFALVAAREAWKASGFDAAAPSDPRRVGCVVGVGIGGLTTLEENLSLLLASGPRRVSPFLIPAMISNLAPGNLAIEFDLKGINMTVTSACASGTHAIGESYRLIKDGIQDVMLTGGTEAAITPLGVAGFARMRALSTRNDEPERASRPFDAERDGFVIGEGAGILVLEEYESAKRRGARIVAEVLGYGYSCDAHHIAAPMEDGQGAIDCMRMAVESSGLSREDVSYINAHGTSTPMNDSIESMAIEKVFGGHARKGLLVSSTKSMTGHLLGAAGGIEAVFLAMAIKEGIVPPTINLEKPGEGCNLDYVAKEARRVSIEAGMSNSFGFGGTNAAVIFGRV